MGGFFMPEQARLYDLMLVLSMNAEDDRRSKLLSDIESQITSGGGTVERNDDWNRRPMAYEIKHQAEGEYHLFQFTGPTALLETLSHNLRIDDSVLRFRIIKVVQGTPPAPESAPPVMAGASAAAPAAPEIER
jgi:small subunit ribosomal protein S6